MKTVIEQLRDFIDALENKTSESYAPSNLWLQDDVMRVYVRKGRRIIYPKKISTTLDIGSVTVEEDEQGKGHWTTFIKAAHQLHPWEATFVESVLNLDLAASLIRHGWFSAPPPATDSYFFPKDPEKFYQQQYLQQKYSNPSPRMF